MVIVGIDPGTTRIGFGVIKKDGGSLRCLDYGLIASSPADGRCLNSQQVISEIQSLLSKHRPDAVAIEKIFFFKNQKTVISVSEMRGVLMAAVATTNTPIYEYTPLQVKQAVSSYGRAGKDQIEAMVRLILGLKGRVKPDDAADGLAIAICCANTIL